LDKFKLDVSAALSAILGDSGAKAILFYIGEPTPETFETKLRSILGNGSALIIQELKRRTQAEVGHPKHRWFGDHS
jgi:hypothetical protein